MKTRVRKKPQAKLRKIREPRTVIVSFRLRKTEAKLLQQDLKGKPIAGVKSLKQFARKLVIDFAKGRLVYSNPTDRQIDSDAGERLSEMKELLSK